MAVASDGDRAAMTTATDVAPPRKPASLQAEDIYEWIVRRRADEIPKERLLSAIRTAARVVPLGGQSTARDASTALISAHSDAISTSSKPEDVFYDVLLTCVKLPTPLAREHQRNALECFLTKDPAMPLVVVPTTTDDSDAWWQAQTKARRAYFSARRAFFLVRIELLRVAAFPSERLHPHASLIEDVVNQLVSEGLVDALLEELCGRAQVTAPAFYSHLRSSIPTQSAERHLRAAQRDWERQLLAEEELVRELLLWALYAANERVPVRRVTTIFEHVLQWPALVLPEVLTDHSLASPVVQRTLSRVASIGSMILMLLARRVSSSQLDDEWPTVTEWTNGYVLTEAWRDVDIDEHHLALCNQLTESGAALVAWASLLAKLFRRVQGRQSGQLEEHLQAVIQLSEQAHAFQQISDVLQRLVVSPAVSYDNASALPSSSSAIFQIVGAMFLDDALSALGYVEHLEDVAQLQAMTKLIVPTLAHPSVADPLLQDRPVGDSSIPEYSSALSSLVTASRGSWPENLLPGLRVLSALCASGATASRSTGPSSLNRLRPATQLSLTELSKSRHTQTTHASQWRQLPPDEFLDFEDDQQTVTCKRTFSYTDDDRLTIHEGVKGLLDQDDSGDVIVQWQIALTESRNGYDALLAALDGLVDQVQSQPLIAIHATEMETLTAFLEWLAQAANAANGATVVVQVLQQWAFARLKQWWRGAMGTTTSLDGPTLLFRAKVSLPVLQSASREDLVAWGIHDRFTREQLLSRIQFPGGSSSVAAHQQRRAASHEELQRDGLTHLLRMLLGFLDGFLNADQLDDTDGLQWTPKQFEFIAAVLGAVATMADALGLAIDVLLHDLGGGSDECVALVTKSARKLFDLYESSQGRYPGMVAALSILRNVSRWCVAADGVGGAMAAQVAPAERVWLVATVEFVMEVVGALEMWEFQVASEKWALWRRALAVFTELLSATSQHSEDGGVLRDFQDALRHTIVTDAGLLMKVLRACGRLVASDIKSTADSDDSERFLLPSENTTPLYPFAFEREVDDGVASVLARESLVETAYRLLDLVLEEKSFTPAAIASVLLQPIDLDTASRRSGTHDLNLVTLSAGYLAYPLAKRPQVVHASLKLLRRAAHALAPTSSPSTDGLLLTESSSSTSLVTLFRHQDDLAFVRDTLLALVRQPARTDAGRGFRKELLGFLTTCLDTQPGLFAFVVLEDSGSASQDPVKRLVGLVERLLAASDEALETETDVLCSVLRFVHHVWVGGVRGRRTLHSQIARALRKSAAFWRHLTLALRVRLPVAVNDSDEEEKGEEGDDEQDETAIAALATGRAGVYGCVARGLIFEVLACEWHYSQRVMSDEHPLTAVLESFREEGLYAQWLRAFTRLDYAAPRFVRVASQVTSFLQPFVPATSEADSGGEGVLAYHEEMAEATEALAAQLAPLAARNDSLTAVCRRVRWSGAMAAHVQAQLYALAQWKVFMELYALQLGSSDGDDDEGFTATRKRKESMIASPVRGVRSATAPGSPLPHHSSSSLFSGDRTSFGMIQVLSDVVARQCERHEQQAGGVSRGGASQPPMDALSLRHLAQVTALLVSMLHHQIRVVLRKTRDPKLSSTRPRDDIGTGGSSSVRVGRLTVGKSLELLALVERAARLVFSPRDSDQTMTDADRGSSPLWETLLGSQYAGQLARLVVELRCSLLTAALLLTRHVAAQLEASGAIAHELQQRAVLVQVKWAHHAIQSIQQCDEDDDSGGRVFKLSWSLLHALLDEFAVATSSLSHGQQRFQLDAILTLAPLMSLLQHETSGLRSLFEIVADKLQSSDAAQQTQACAVLKGLNAVVWNPRNMELCRRVMLASGGFNVLRFFAQRLVPGLREAMDSTMRGYVGEEGGGRARCRAHQAWCSVLMMAAGLVRHLPPHQQHQQQHPDSSVWEFLSAAEPLLATALATTQGKLNRAVVDEQACVLSFLNALSSTASRRKQWREMLPRNCVVLMEQSRLVLRRACVLVGNASYTATHSREKQQQQAQLSKKPRRLSVTAWPLSTSPRALALGASASLTFAHQTLLHEHLEPATLPERRNLPGFFEEMESKLLHVVEQAAHLLLKWTASLVAPASTVTVNGVREIDGELLVPLLAFATPSESLSMSYEPSIGHLCVAMEYCVDQLKNHSNQNQTQMVVAANTLQTAALLFLKTYLLHLNQQETTDSTMDADQQKDVTAFFEQLLDELKEAQAADPGRVDVPFFQQILKVLQLKVAKK